MPICETRYGSSPYDSSSRPQRGSRQMSSTGDRPWWAPIARIWARTASASRRLSSGPERRGDAERLREHRSLAGHQPGADLLVEDGGDAEPRVLDQVSLDRVRDLRCLRRPEAAGAAHPRHMTDAVGEQRGGTRRVEAAFVGDLEHPHAAESDGASPRPTCAPADRRRDRRPTATDRGTARRRMGGLVICSSIRWSFPHRSRCEAADDLTLGDGVEDQCRDH